jgi:hypothetical protein
MVINASRNIHSSNRICAGRFLAERIGFTMAMSILLAYDIVPVDGKETPSIKDTLYEDAVIRSVVFYS